MRKASCLQSWRRRGYWVLRLVVVQVTSHFPPGSYARRQKHAKYDGGFVGSDFVFCALVFETTGGINLEGVSFLKQLFRFSARRQNASLSVYAGRAWARLSCNLCTQPSLSFSPTCSLSVPLYPSLREGGKKRFTSHGCEKKRL